MHVVATASSPLLVQDRHRPFPTVGAGSPPPLPLCWCRIATASKDASAKLLQLTPSGSLSVVVSWEDAHGGGVVKSARMRPRCDGRVVGTAGNDGHGRVWDARQDGGRAAVELGRHAGARGGEMFGGECGERGVYKGEMLEGEVW